MGAKTHADVFASAEARTDGKRGIIGLDKAELAAVLSEAGLEKWRAKQLWHWVYHRGVTDFAKMTTFAKPVRDRLAENFIIDRPQVDIRQVSEDGTKKWLFRWPDGQQIETVHIPESDRGTLCVSSQVGCTLTCRFCHTGTQRLVRNLQAGEIVGQIMAARDDIGEWPSPSDDRMISNIVMMGMGEPLFNYENVAKALKIVMDGEGIAISKRRITLSTSGVVPMIERCGQELGVNLAISLHAVTDELRDKIIPLNRKYPIKDLMKACKNYPAASNTRRITFEYVMLKDVNDSDADAKALVKLIKGLPAKVNLIPFNPWPGSPFECSDWDRINGFAAIVNKAGYASPVRKPRGRDILAACGQLKSASLRLSAAERAAMDKTIAEKDKAQGLA
jgi:23S rRNA (adenine2503-C2)-methyltransferase